MAVLHPLNHVAVHVVEAKGVGFFFPTGCVLPSEFELNQA